MAMNEHPEQQHETGTETGDALLPCGRDLADLWDQQDTDGQDLDLDPQTIDPHTAGCPHCTAALADLTQLQDRVMHDGHEAGVDWEACASRLTASVMDVVRLELRPGRTLALGEMDEDAWIYEAVAARTFRAAAERVPGVRAGSCRISPQPAPPPGGRAPACVRIEVTLRMTADLQLAADRIRRHIAEAAEQDLGMQITSIDVVITDLYHEPPGEDPR